jgi:hypothetical protein
MARIDIKSAGATLSDGVLQLENGVAMDATLRNVADQNNTTSPLKLSTNLVQTTSTLKITTDNNPYIDAEDGSSNNRFTVGRDSSSQQVNVDFASNPTGSTTTVGAIRTYQDGVNLSEVVKFREDGQVTFSERVNVEADSLVTTQSSSVIAATTTNANLVIAPNGTGALVADIPDGTATGGNARGTNAVDFQITRGAASNVANGNYSTISGGQSNTASSANSTVSGGQSNTASTNTHATVVGGQSNTSSGQYSVSGGLSNVASGIRSVSFGWLNQSTTDNAITLGYQNMANGNYAAVIGAVGTATGQFSLSTGYNNVTIARSSAIIGSETSRTEGLNSVILGGIYGKSHLYSQVVFNPNTFTAQGDNQNSQLNAYREATLTTGGTTTLSLDGTGTTNLIIPNGNNRMWNVQVAWVAVVTAITGTATGVTVGDTKTSTDLLAVARRSGTTTVSAHTSAGTQVIETIAGSLTAANIAYTAGASQEMAITFTGPTFAGGGSVTMRVVARVQLTEVAY